MNRELVVLKIKLAASSLNIAAIAANVGADQQAMAEIEAALREIGEVALYFEVKQDA